MKFSLWQIMVLLTVAAIAIAWREVITEPLVNLLGLPIEVVKSAPLLCGMYALYFSFGWFYQSGHSPVWRLGAWAASFHDRPVVLSVLRFILRPPAIAYGLLVQGNAELDQADYLKSISLVDRAISDCPLDPNMRVSRGAAYYGVGELDKAIADFSYAIELDPNHVNAFAHRGIAHFSSGNYQTALDDLILYECVSVDDAMTALTRGKTFELLTHWECAAEDYELATQLDPTLIKPVQALSVLQACCPDALFRDATKALENAQRTCVLTDWKDWVSCSCLAAAYAEANDFEAAIKYAKQAEALAPDEEKETRAQRVREFESGKPFRLPATPPES